MFLCRNRQFLQESSIFEMRVVNVFVNRFFSMKWGIFEKMRFFFCFFHSEWSDSCYSEHSCHSERNEVEWRRVVERSEKSREHPLNTLTLCYRDSSLRSEWQLCDKWKLKTTLLRQPQPLGSRDSDDFLEGTAEGVLRIEAALLGNGFEGKALLLFLFEQDLRLLDA